jgi:hypothetical protein
MATSSRGDGPWGPPCAPYYGSRHRGSDPQAEASRRGWASHPVLQDCVPGFPPPRSRGSRRRAARSVSAEALLHPWPDRRRAGSVGAPLIIHPAVTRAHTGSLEPGLSLGMGYGTLGAGLWRLAAGESNRALGSSRRRNRARVGPLPLRSTTIGGPNSYDSSRWETTLSEARTRPG